MVLSAVFIILSTKEEIIMQNLKKFRINYYGGASFWVCDDNEANKRTLTQAGVFFWRKKFQAADGSIVSRLEWND